MNPEEFAHAFLEEHGDDVVVHYSLGYDPVKAKEYYERTKKLKGRKPGSGVAPASTTGKTAVAKATPAKKSPTASPSTSNVARLRAEASSRQAKLKVRLARLEEVLDMLMEQIQSKNGPETKDSSSSEKKTASKDTAKEKPRLGCALGHIEGSATSLMLSSL